MLPNPTSLTNDMFRTVDENGAHYVHADGIDDASMASREIIGAIHKAIWTDMNVETCENIVGLGHTSFDPEGSSTPRTDGTLGAVGNMIVKDTISAPPSASADKMLFASISLVLTPHVDKTMGEH